MKRCCYLLFCLLVFGIISCQQKQPSGKALSQQQITEQLVEANKAVLDIENEQIDNFISANGWNVVTTGTGLRFQILEKGNGLKAKPGKLVRFEYDMKLITGETIYSSSITGPKEFRIGSGGVESGLEEGILLLKVGDSARFIIPSYLAHGLSGDQDKIPSKATLIYSIKLIDLK